MKIVIVNVPYYPYLYGGAERSVGFLAEGLVKAGNEVVVATIYPGAKEVTEMVNGVKVRRLPIANLYWPYNQRKKPNLFYRAIWHLNDVWNKKAAREFGILLDEERPDVVHTNVIAGFSASIWSEVKKRNIRLVHTLRDYYLLCGRSSLMRNGKACHTRCLECRYLTKRRLRASSLIDAIGSNSLYVLKRHENEKDFPAEQRAVIFNIVHLKSIPKDIDDPEALHPLHFGYIGRIEREKGIEVVLRATQQLRSKRWKLSIAGSGVETYVEKLRKEYGSPSIEWLGFTKPDNFYRSIDVNIVPSIWPEPLPRTLIETIASGKPAICASSGGIPEISKLGKSIQTYPPEDALALATIMDELIASPKRNPEAGWTDERNANLFTEKWVVSEYKKLYG